MKLITRQFAIALAAVIAAAVLPPYGLGATAPADEAAPHWKLHTDVEVKWGGLYRKASIVNQRGDWYLIAYDRGTVREWVEPWRLRKIGSTEDAIGYARPNPVVRGAQGPPSEKPGPPALPAGHQAPAPAPAASPATDHAPAPDPAAAAPATGVPTATAVDRAQSAGVLRDVETVRPLTAPSDPQIRPAHAVATHAIPLRYVSTSVFDAPRSAFVSSGAKVSTAAVVHAAQTPNQPAELRVERVDLLAGSTLTIAHIAASDRELDLSPDAKLLACRSTAFGFGGAGRLDVWDVSAAGEAPLAAAFVPFDDLPPVDRDIHWCRFIDNEHLAAMTGRGSLAVFEFRKARQVWAAESMPGTEACVSAGGRHLAFVAKGGKTVAVVEASSGKALAAFPIAQWPGARLAFSPDGSRLAFGCNGSVQVWKLADGSTVAEAGAGPSTIDHLIWPADDFLLVNSQSLISLDRQMLVWTYAAPAGAIEFHGTAAAGRFWFVAGPANGAKASLASAEIPGPPVTRVLANLNVARDLLLHPGASVRLVVSLPAEQQEAATAALKAKLTAIQITVADDAAVSLVASSEPGKTVDIEYSQIGAGPGGKSRVSAQTVKLTLSCKTADGKSVWERSTISAPPTFLSLKPGQTADQAVHEAMRQSYQFFEQVRPPRFLARSPNGLGSSTLSAAGATDTR